MELDLDSLASPVEESESGRSATLWPFPGGQDDSSSPCSSSSIGSVRRRRIGLPDLTAWVLETFEKVTKKDVVTSTCGRCLPRWVW